mgnify:CR=1 FL=1
MIFLRPYFLLLLILPVIFWAFHKTRASAGAWAKVCDPHLLPYLTIDVAQARTRAYAVLMSLLWTLGCIMLAGPALPDKDLPTASAQTGIVAVVDMSPAMSKGAAQQMTRKLYDLADMQKDALIGLVLSDEVAYTALPMTQDKAFFKNIIPSLKERVMPRQGQNYAAGIKRAEQLLAQSGFKNGQILLITAGTDNVQAIRQAVAQSAYPVAVIGVGAIEPQPVLLENGQFWQQNGTPKMIGVKALPAALGRSYRYAALDESDLGALLDFNKMDNVEKHDLTSKQYLDFGIFGMLFLVPLTALLYRKGVLFILALMFASCPAYAGFWWRTEQEDYQTQMQGIADFNVGHYDRALQSFDALPQDPEALYNKGNTLAYMGRIDQAIEAYTQALALNPVHEDARFNMEYLKRQQQKQQEQNQEQAQQEQNQEQQNAQSDANADAENKAADATSQTKSNNANADESSSPDSNADNKNTDSGQNGEQNKASNQSTSASPKTDEKTASQMVPGSQTDQAGAQKANALVPTQEPSEQKPDSTQSLATDSDKPLSAEKQAEQEWLSKVNPDAGRVLRYRLLKQYEEQR